MSSQEEKEEIFNQIIKYYDFAEEILGKIENKLIPEESIEDIGELLEEIESFADDLTDHFAIFSKGDISLELSSQINEIFEDLITRIEYCKTKIENQSDQE